MSDHFLEQCRPVALEDKALFNRYFSRFPPAISELTFTNILCWAEVKHHLHCTFDGHLLISFRDDHGYCNFFPPIGPHAQRIMEKKFSEFTQYRWSRVPEHLAHTVDLGVRPVYDRKNSDYVYRLADLQNLQGKKYDGKRNFIRRCAALQPEVRPLRTKDAPACLRIQEQWLESQKSNPSARDESTALMKALQHFDALPLRGIGVFIDGVLVAFAIGEPLNPTTFVEHFEKALAHITGIYPFVLHEFAKSIPRPFTHLNREQDLGIEGIRKSKESWVPEYLVRKYTLRIRSH